MAGHQGRGAFLHRRLWCGAIDLQLAPGRQKGSAPSQHRRLNSYARLRQPIGKSLCEGGSHQHWPQGRNHQDNLA